jgi:chromosome partitioning protein
MYMPSPRMRVRAARWSETPRALSHARHSDRRTRASSRQLLEILFDQIATLGLVANRVEQDGEAKEMMEWFGSTVGDRMPVWEVRKRVAIKRVWNNGVSVFSHEEECDMENVFLETAVSVEDHE